MNDQLKNRFRKILQERLNRMGRNLQGLEEFLVRHDLKMRWRLDNLKGIANWHDENGDLPIRDTETTIVIGIYGPATWPSTISRIFPGSKIKEIVCGSSGPVGDIFNLQRCVLSRTGILASKDFAMKAIVLGDIP